MPMTTTATHIEINPDQPAIGSVIWLHGLGADGSDFVPIVPELKLPSSLPLRFIFPHAPMRPVTINNGYVMRAWFDIYSLNNLQQIDHDGITESITTLNKLIDQEVKRGIPEDKIVLAGFSQGAAIALATGLLYQKSLAGILALSGYLPQPEKILTESNVANDSTPIFLAHGTEDLIVPFALGEHLYDVLLKNEYLVKWHSYAMAHAVCGEEIGDIAEWLREIF